jgi:transposase-like protein
MSDDGETTVCPECDGTNIVSQVGGPLSNGSSAGDWLCRDCSEHFEEPDTRRKKWPNGISGLAYDLWMADKEEWP